MPDRPKYLRVADTLRREIAEGVFKDGQTLMTEEELRVRFGVSRQTVRQAIALLEDDGLVDRRRGSGTYVQHGSRKRKGLIRVGVVMNYITDYIAPTVISGMEAVMNRAGAVMSLSATYGESGMEKSILERMLDGQVDGAVIEGAHTAAETPNRELYRRMAERNIPVLFLNGFYPDMGNIPHVVMDDEAGGRMAAEELIRRGYRRPCGLFKTDDLQGEERLRGFLKAMEAAGTPVPEENILRFGTAERMTLWDTRQGKTFMDRLIRREMDAVACYNDIFAVWLMNLLKEQGVKLPEEIGFISFDDAPMAAMSRPGLTSLAHPKEEFGALAAGKILRMIEGKPESSIRVKWTLRERESLPRRNGD